LKRSRSNKTILGQLLLNITIPVILVLSLFAYANYYWNKQELEELNRQRLEQIRVEVQNLIEIYDYGMKMNEVHFEKRMEKISHQLVKILENQENFDTIDLYQLSDELGLDTSMESIYIIDTNGVIVNTTFPKDLHLDFYARGYGYKEFFQRIWDKGVFYADRFSEEEVTNRIKKWSFIPTIDGNHIVELGFLSEEAKILKDNLLKKVREISDQHKDIQEVYLAMQIKGQKFIGISDSLLQKNMQEVLKSRKNMHLVSEKDGKNVIEDLIYIEILIDEMSMFSGIVLYIRSDDSREKELIHHAVIRFLLMTGLSLALLIFIVVMRARRITRPIKRLTQKAEIISSGNLGERITPEGNNEITQLTESFNNMVEQLQESYQTLEQKVLDRTAEVVEQRNDAEHQRHLVEEKNKEIMDSINYAKRIQNAILPSDYQFTNALPDSFVLYLPKDVVAGDFYWMERIDDRVLFAAADCTGHGVPGALVSIVCNNALNRTVREFGLLKPGKILDKAREIVIQEFEKSDNDVKDGMVISLVALTVGTDGHLSVQWAGANNPLWLIRNGEVLETKPDKQPIGKYVDPKPFTTHTMDLQKGEIIYIFTDGFQDQFGGEKGKKFKAASLKQLLLSIQHETMERQRELLIEAFENWRAGYEQIDDVCIIGVKV
jgi:serine phosphatase RsbU (regulator of sigma subunit)